MSDVCTTIDLGPERVRFKNIVSVPTIRQKVGDLGAYKSGRSQSTFHDVESEHIAALLKICVQMNPSCRRAIEKLLDCAIASSCDGHVNEKSESVGAGFSSDAVQNARVEQAAIDCVAGWYRDRGWRVQDKQRANCGYDLHCTKKTKEVHVEVKGVSGDMVQFILTQNEYRCARADELYLLCVVVNALTDDPEIVDIAPKVLLASYDATPIAYMIKPKSGVLV